MTKWRQVPIRDLCESIIDCVNKTAPTVGEPTPYRMIRTTNVKNGRVDLRSVKYVHGTTYERWIRRGRPQMGDIILTREAPLGEVGILRDAGGVFLGQRLVMYRVDENRADRHFLLAAMRGHNVQAQIKSLGSGSTVEHMRVPDCGELLIACPALKHQQRIGSVLSAFEELTAINERRIELLEDLAASLYREWFVRFRFPGHEREADTDGALPTGWETARLGDVAELLMGQSPRSEFYNDAGVGLPFHQGVSDYGPLIPTHRKYSSQGPRQARAGDVLCSVRAPVGRLNLADRDLIAGRGLAAIRRRDGHGALLFEQLRHALGKEDSIGGGTIFKAVGKDELSSLPLVESTKAVGAAFEVACRPMLDERVALTLENRTLAHTRDLLLPRLVTGRLDISDIDLGGVLSAEIAA